MSLEVHKRKIYLHLHATSQFTVLTMICMEGGQNSANIVYVCPLLADDDPTMPRQCESIAKNGPYCGKIICGNKRKVFFSVETSFLSYLKRGYN